MRYGYDSDKVERNDLPHHRYVRPALQPEKDWEVEGRDVMGDYPQFEIGVCSVDIKYVLVLKKQV